MGSSSRAGMAVPVQLQRVFIAIFPDSAACEAIADVVASLEPALSSSTARIARERFHVTVHFLGDYDQGIEEVERRAMAACASIEATSFNLRLDRLGSFKASRPIGILQASQVPADLLTLWSALRTRLARAGFGQWLRPDFSPHVTLFHGDRELPAQAIIPIAWPATEFRLIRRAVGQGGYHELGRWPLSAAS